MLKPKKIVDVILVCPTLFFAPASFYGKNCSPSLPYQGTTNPSRSPIVQFSRLAWDFTLITARFLARLAREIFPTKSQNAVSHRLTSPLYGVYLV
jgi:hypothetical protein